MSNKFAIKYNFDDFLRYKLFSLTFPIIYLVNSDKMLFYILLRRPLMDLNPNADYLEFFCIHGRKAVTRV